MNILRENVIFDFFLPGALTLVTSGLMFVHLPGEIQERKSIEYAWGIFAMMGIMLSYTSSIMLGRMLVHGFFEQRRADNQRNFETLLNNTTNVIPLGNIQNVYN